MRKAIGILCAGILVIGLMIYFSKAKDTSVAEEPSIAPAVQAQAPATAAAKRRPVILRTGSSGGERAIAAVADVPENPKLARAADILREANLETKAPTGRFVTGKRVPSSRGNFLSSNVRAMPRDEYDQSQGDLVETRAGYAIFVPKSEDAAAQEAKDVVVNANNGRLGIVTGTIIAQLKNAQDRFSLSSEFGLKIVAVDEAINAVFFSTDADPEQSVEALQKDSRVQNAELEIVDGVKESL